ncbi:hypothetical protein Tco_0700919, partial [Tanacetum coccineum]
MVACLERTDGDADFHQIVDFLTTSPIHYALTVSPTIYASYIKQFWATAKSKTVNDVKQIHAIVDGKTLVVSESSVRSDLHFNDEDGITCLSNDEIFVNLALMGVASQSQKTHTPRRAKRGRDTEIPQSSGPPKKVSDEAVYTREDGRVVRAATTTSSLEAKQESGSGPRVLALEHSKTAKDLVIKRLQKNVNRLEKKQRARTPGMKLFKIGTSKRKSVDKENNVEFNAGDAVNTATTGVSAASASVTTAGMRNEKAKEKGVAFRDVEESVRPTRILLTIDPKDKGKGI